MIQDFISDICDILNIQEPNVSYDTSHFQSSTMMAQCSTDGSAIYLKKYDKPNPDQLFAIAHELRHIWQLHDNWHLYFSSYKSVDLCSSLEEYNLQLAELDANAFACIIMEDFFGITPLFNGIPDSVKSKIRKRMDHISSDFIS